MARPTDTGALAEAVYSQVAPVAYDDEANDWALLIFIAAIGQMFQQSDTLARNWAILVDVDQVPDEGLPWLGQLVGVRVDTSQSTDYQRQQIRWMQGTSRGTTKELKRAIRNYLSDTQTVVVIERYPDPYSIIINTYADETPPDTTYQDYYDQYPTYQAFYDAWATYEEAWENIQTVRILQDLLAAKAAGLRLSYQILPGSPSSELVSNYEQIFLNFETYQELYDSYQTYEFILNDQQPDQQAVVSAPSTGGLQLLGLL